MRSDEADLDIKRSKIDEQLSTWIDSLSEQKKLCVQGKSLMIVDLDTKAN
jgi:hypothetical protein